MNAVGSSSVRHAINLGPVCVAVSVTIDTIAVYVNTITVGLCNAISVHCSLGAVEGNLNERQLALLGAHDVSHGELGCDRLADLLESGDGSFAAVQVHQHEEIAIARRQNC